MSNITASPLLHTSGQIATAIGECARREHEGKLPGYRLILSNYNIAGKRSAAAV
ncbi:hypothetical protein [Paraburkholderia sp. J41]|uniref:hypothetical protein n=1 Tax=Paraburkholderia sp. J41 TaxID=2805433 RepID=UPI002AC346D0|nr:hypothetical protein [Paraburkholderia sp. J41]